MRLCEVLNRSTFREEIRGSAGCGKYSDTNRTMSCVLPKVITWHRALKLPSCPKLSRTEVRSALASNAGNQLGGQLPSSYL